MRLQQGQIIELPDSGVAEVLFVNDSRARIKLLNRTKKIVHTSFGEEVSFLASGRIYDISPNSEVKIVKGIEDKPHPKSLSKGEEPHPKSLSKGEGLLRGNPLANG